MKQRKTIIALFWTLSIINVIANWIQHQQIIYLTKPFLMATLALWFYLNVKNKLTIFAKYILIGIIFSIAGDSFLMFLSYNPQFFLYGLGSFLITHLCYIIAFRKYPNSPDGIVVRKKWLVLPVLLYLISFLIYLWNDIPAAFKIAVAIYGSIISLMLISALNMRWRISTRSSNYLIMGALLFVISDSAIAINKFTAATFSTATMSIFIMSTYILGQYLIAKSTIIINNKYPINSN